MTMRKWAGSVLFTAAGAAAVVGMTVGPALASTTLTVKVSHGGSYTATAKKTVLSDNNVAVTCSTKGKTPSSKAGGKLSNGTHRGKAPVSLGQVSSLVFNNCSGALGPVKTKVQAKPTLKADSKTNSKGDTDAVITGVKVSVSMTDCSFTVTGSVPGYYSNKTHTLTMTSHKLPVKALTKAQLTVSGVPAGECGGLVNNGDHPTYNASYTVSRKVVIKSS
jgi:hypothetical protein